jgi:hypothetical protein
MHRLWKGIALASLGLIIIVIFVGLRLFSVSPLSKNVYAAIILICLDVLGGVGLIAGANRSEHFYSMTEEWSKIMKRSRQI